MAADRFTACTVCAPGPRDDALSRVANITIDVKAKAKDLTIAVDEEGSTFTITGPRDVERGGWSDTIENALKRVSTKG